MNKPLLLSLAAATLLGTNLNAETMYERIQAMELEMNKMKKELTTLKAATAEEDEEESEVTTADDEESEDEENEGADSDEEGDEEEEDEEMDVEEEIRDIQESITELNKGTSGNHLKFGVDYRFAIDNLNYKMADGEDAGNDALLSNRLWINMNWAANKNLSFSGQLAYNKAFGQRSGWNSSTAGMEDFDWITNENPYDDSVSVRSAYFLYRNSTFVGSDIPWTFSVGRRPSTTGHLINYREDDAPSSPMGHTINVEFDGLSAKFSFDKWVDGMYFKFCAGRGGTNAGAKFFAVNPVTGAIESGAPYATNNEDLPPIDLGGLIFVPYDNGQYSISTQFYYANNLIDADISYPGGVATYNGMETVGGLYSATANFAISGIGDEWSDYLDDTVFFVSGAMSTTDPKDGENMIGGENSESLTGYSYWVGLHMPSFISDEGKWGLEYNHGDKYWRSITYAEDTMAGSKIAARGNAYEAYFTEYLVDDILSLQIRYTYIDYEYTGSNGFFGNATGTPMKIEDLTPAMGSGVVVDTAQDIRFYLRYKY